MGTTLEQEAFQLLRDFDRFLDTQEREIKYLRKRHLEIKERLKHGEVRKY